MASIDRDIDADNDAADVEKGATAGETTVADESVEPDIIQNDDHETTVASSVNVVCSIYCQLGAQELDAEIVGKNHLYVVLYFYFC